MLACLAHAGAAAYERPGGFDAPAGRESRAISGAPAFCGMCREAGDCAFRSARARPGDALGTGRFRAPPEVVKAIDTASAVTGADFEYLLRAAALESSFNPALEAATSTAAGLYQFIEGSWLHMVEVARAEIGLDVLAEEAGEGGGGVTEDAGEIAMEIDGEDAREELAEEAGEQAEQEAREEADEEMREAILRLRYDPELSAIMAGLFTRRNFAALAQILEREPDSGELYVAHVFGAAGAADLIRLKTEKPDALARKHFPRAARANRAIFFDGKKPRTVAEVYEFLTEKYRNIAVGGESGRPSASPQQSYMFDMFEKSPLPSWRVEGDPVPYAMR